MEKKIITEKICPKCGSGLIYSRSPGWGTESKWKCLKCQYEEKEEYHG